MDGIPFRTWGNRVLDRLYPPACVLCRGVREPIPGFPGLCRTCLSRLPHRVGTDRWLPCLEHPVARDPLENMRVAVALHYRGPVRNLLLDLKFHDASHAARTLGALCAPILRERAVAADLVASVPLHPERKRERGYDQAALVAAGLAEGLRLPLGAGLLVRTRSTRPQSTLTGHGDRIRNMADSFACPCPDRVRGRQVVLADDVLTSGATLHAAALALARAGARSVTGATAASGRREEGGGLLSDRCRDDILGLPGMFDQPRFLNPHD